MRKKKILLFFLTSLICFTLILVQNEDVFAKPIQQDIIIEVDGGFGGVAKLGVWCPITITVYSSNRNISGEIEVEVFVDQVRKIIVSKPVELIAGIEQEVYFEIPVVTAQKGAEIRLIENKKVQADVTYNFKRLLPPEDILIGVLSEDSESFNWLNGNTVPLLANRDVVEKMNLMIAAGQISTSTAYASVMPIQEDYIRKHDAYVIPLNRNSFPYTEEVIGSFDFFIISKYDTSLLNDAQVSALEDWVESGGVLVAGTGLSWQKVYHGLPESLKPFSVTGLEDVQTADILEKFTGRDAENINLKLVKGELGFESILVNDDTESGFGNQYLFHDNYIIAGDQDNPLAIKYQKGNGAIVILTFDPTVEPFASWHAKVSFMENVFKYANTSLQSRINDYYRNYSNKSSYIQNLATDVPFDKVPPFGLMFIILGIYVVLVGPALYIILKVTDRRDFAWVMIPVLSVVFLSCMYLFGFNTRYNTAIVNTASLIEIEPGSNEALVSSAIGVFNNRRGTLTIEYGSSNGIKVPFIEHDVYYGYYGRDTEGKVVAKYTISEPVKFEQYDVSLWSPKVLYAQQTIPFNGNILNNITIKDGRLKGTIENSTPYDLLDAMLIIGNNIVRIGDIVAWDSFTLDIPFDGTDVYKHPEDYLVAMYGSNYYNTPKEYPDNFKELNQKRRLFENYLSQAYNINRGKPTFTLLAMNEQEFDYGLTVNAKEPQKYNRNLISMESALNFVPGQEIEIPAGIVIPSMYQDSDIAWLESDNAIRIHDTGDLEFEFVLPENINVNEMRFYSEQYIPLHLKYTMSQDSSQQIDFLSNTYQFYIYNVKTKSWDEIKSDAADGYIFDISIKGDTSQYIGLGNEVRMKISVVEIGEPYDEDGKFMYYYYEEIITMPDIYLKGVSK